jgi:hypothetical protein
MQHSGAGDGSGRLGSTVSQVHVGCKQKSGSVGAVDETAGVGALQQSRAVGSSSWRWLLGNATSHADQHGDGYPPALAMQHSGGADLAAALHR